MATDSSEGPDPLAVTAKETGESLYRGLLDTLLTGIAITIPLVITVYVLSLVLEFINNALRPLIDFLQWLGVIRWFESVHLIQLLIDLGIYSFVLSFLTELITIGLLVGVILVVGTFGQNQYGERVIDFVDLTIASIPGIGAVYKSFRRMGDVMLNEEAENFQSVKMVQCLGDNMYVLGFKTSDSPPTIEESTTHEDMVAMFLPLAPNPVTGGFLTYVPESDVYDIDMTIEEGVRSILTSGIATGDGTDQRREVTIGDLGNITDLDLQEALVTEGEEQATADDTKQNESAPYDVTHWGPDRETADAERTETGGADSDGSGTGHSDTDRPDRD